MIYIPNNAYQWDVQTYGERHIPTYSVFHFSNLLAHGFPTRTTDMFASFICSWRLLEGETTETIEIKAGSVFRTFPKSVSPIFPIPLTVLIKLMKFYCLGSTDVAHPHNKHPEYNSPRGKRRFNRYKYSEGPKGIIKANMRNRCTSLMWTKELHSW